MIPIRKTLGLVLGSSAAAGSADLTLADCYRKTACVVTLTGAGSVLLHGSADGTRYAPATPAVTATDTIHYGGPLPYLRVVWTGNTGQLTVDVVQSDGNPGGLS